jgi:hypothetical protein
MITNNRNLVYKSQFQIYCRVNERGIAVGGVYRAKGGVAHELTAWWRGIDVNHRPVGNPKRKV